MLQPRDMIPYPHQIRNRIWRDFKLLVGRINKPGVLAQPSGFCLLSANVISVIITLLLCGELPSDALFVLRC
jgi:hypothetical protein